MDDEVLHKYKKNLSLQSLSYNLTMVHSMYILSAGSSIIMESSESRHTSLGELLD
jgi:hypothetical protein